MTPDEFEIMQLTAKGDSLLTQIKIIIAERDNLRLSLNSALKLLDMTGPYAKEARFLWGEEYGD